MAATIRTALLCRGQTVLSSRLTALFISRQCGYAKKVSAQAKKKVAPMPVAEKKFLEPETDPKKLTTFLCGGNIMKEGQDPELKPDSEYPDWLWTLRTERGAVPLEELDQDTWQYWKRVRRESIKEQNKRKENMYKYRDFKTPDI